MTELPAAQRLDLRKTTIDDVLSRVEKSLQLAMNPEGAVRKRRSIGFRSDRDTWVRVECRGFERFDGQGWGLEAAQVLEGVPLPRWHAGISWLDSERKVMWRADETQLIESEPVKRGSANPNLSDTWWATLTSSLRTLAAFPTTRVATVPVRGPWCEFDHPTDLTVGRDVLLALDDER